jgi:hypothetical protein
MAMRYISRVLSLPSPKELLKTWAGDSPALTLERRDVGVAVEHFGPDLEPVVEEGRLHLRDGGTLQAEVAVTPVLRILRVARPVVRDADSAREGHPPVHDEQLAMGPVIDR